ncbi:MAG TPA: chromate efflux transporter [Marinagarivorans sp.]
MAIFGVFLLLGCTSFGGPVAHLGYFREAFVRRRQWLNEQAYADLVALCQFLPGPASSQVGFMLGYQRGGFAGALAAWLGFTLPSAVLLMLFAMGLDKWGSGPAADVIAGLVQGLKVVAVAIVAQAVWGMAKALCPDPPRQALMITVAGVLLLAPHVWMQLIVLVLAAILGGFLFAAPDLPSPLDRAQTVSRRVGYCALSLFFTLLVVLPLLAWLSPSGTLLVIDAFYRAGALVFGGGHVVLPLLEAEVVGNGWLELDRFMAGYGAAQAIPGPLFTFAAFLGAAIAPSSSVWLGGLIAVVAIFLPAFLLLVGVYPFWAELSQKRGVRRALVGVNAAVVGILLAALIHPISTSALVDWRTGVLAVLAVIALMLARVAPWLVVVGCATVGALFL